MRTAPIEIGAVSILRNWAGSKQLPFYGIAIRRCLVRSNSGEEFELATFSPAVVQAVLRQFPAEGVSVDPEHFRGARLVSICPFQHTLDEALLKLSDRLVK